MNRQKHRREKTALRRGYRRNESGRYAMEKSPLWKLTSIHLLARLMRVTPEALRATAADPTYNRFVDFTRPAKPRNVQEPTDRTMRIHYRLVKLLDSIQRPNFLHSATRKRSSISNARAHLGGENLAATDIRSFYESTTAQHVKKFFLNELGWPHDIAKIMASICTVDGHLPTGSCLSPLLSFFVHKRMFEDIDAVCAPHSVTMTLYVDDLTLSGRGVTAGLFHSVKRIVGRSNLITHKDRLVPRGRPVNVTGAIVGGSRLRLPNKQHKSVVDLIDEVVAGASDQSQTLDGKIAAARAVDKYAASGLVDRLNRLQKS
jgi:hypothetical protein